MQLSYARSSGSLRLDCAKSVVICDLPPQWKPAKDTYAWKRYYFVGSPKEVDRVRLVAIVSG
ncbi:hypothetical protein M422DRAFT_28124 [Sphaerobolus stellatus SS14]|nr:hypothetical protein M422DRAFT_28124 [Sphaerobolus stellatus SS14]